MSNEIQELKQTIYKLQKELNVLSQRVSVRAASDATGTTTISNMPAATDEQIDGNSILIVETGDGTKRGYLSQLLTHTPELDVADIPAANNNAMAGTGFGGFRYQKTGTSLELFVS